mgnify:CR=1 FL=1
MPTSLLYHAYGLTKHKYINAKYKENKVILKIKTKEDKLCCRVCGSKSVIKQGKKERDFRAPPMGNKQIILRAIIQRLECRRCNNLRQEKIGFADEKKTYTKSFERYINDLSRIMTLDNVSKITGMGWDTVKRIEQSYLTKHYSKPRLKEVRYIAIDEFAVQKGHKYMTVVMDLETNRVLFVGEGKSAETLEPFWKRVRCSGAKIQAVATDMWPAFIDSVTKNLPNARLIYDRFHITKMINDALSRLRKQLYHEETAVNKRSVIKGIRWLLLKREDNLNEEKNERERLNQVLELNKPLAIAYYLKEELRLLWMQDSMEKAKDFFGKWLAKAYASGIPVLKKVANSLLAHRTGIFSWFCNPISTGPLEGMNNKIKLLKRQAYGYRDKEFFKLKIYALHKTTYALCG